MKLLKAFGEAIMYIVLALIALFIFSLPMVVVQTKYGDDSGTIAGFIQVVLLLIFFLTKLIYDYNNK